MSYKVLSSSLEFENCKNSDEFNRKLNELIANMEKSEAPYKAKVTLKVEKIDGRITTTTKEISGLNDLQIRMVDELESLAGGVCAVGKEPNKIENSIEIEKEL